MTVMLEKTRRLLWVGIISFLLLLSIPLFGLLFVEPARNGTLLFYSAGTSFLEADFVNFYYAGWMARSPDRLRVYDPEVRMRTSNELVAPHKVAEPLYTGYLPIVFPMMLPFALFPLVPAFFVWTIITAGFGIAALALFTKRVMQWPTRYTIAFCLYALWSLPGFLTLHLGQVVWLLLGLDIVFFWGLLKNRDVPAGIAIALATVKPQYSIPLFAAAIGLKRWKLVAVALGTLLALFVLAGFTIGFDNVARYPTLLHHTEQSDLTARVMASIRPALYAVLPPGPALQVNLSMWVAASIGIGFLWFRARKQGEDKQRWLAAFTIMTALFMSPHTHCHDLLLIFAAAAMTLNVGPKTKPERLWQIIILAYPVLGFAFYIMPVGEHLSRWPFVVTNLILLVLSAVCYFAKEIDVPIERR